MSSQRDRLEAIKEISADQFSQARAYTNVLLAAGYAGLFGLWSILKDSVSSQATVICGLLISLSLAIFLLWELVGMFARHQTLAEMNKLFSSGDEFDSLAQNHAVRMRNFNITLLRIWPYFLWPTIIFGFGAFFVLIASFLSLLFPKLIVPQLRYGDDMSNWAYIVIGSAIAVLMGLAFHRATIFLTRRSYKKVYAEAITDDLNCSADLFSEIQAFWDDKKTILFSLIDEVALSRAIYDNDRAGLYALPRKDLRSRVARYYRQLGGVLSELRRNQSRLYEIEQGNEAAIARTVESIEFQLSRLSDLRLVALELAEETKRWV